MKSSEGQSDASGKTSVQSQTSSSSPARARNRIAQAPGGAPSEPFHTAVVPFSPPSNEPTQESSPSVSPDYHAIEYSREVTATKGKLPGAPDGTNTVSSATESAGSPQAAPIATAAQRSSERKTQVMSEPAYHRTRCAHKHAPRSAAARITARGRRVGADCLLIARLALLSAAKGEKTRAWRWHGRCRISEQWARCAPGRFSC